MCAKNIYSFFYDVFMYICVVYTTFLYGVYVLHVVFVDIYIL